MKLLYYHIAGTLITSPHKNLTCKYIFADTPNLIDQSSLVKVKSQNDVQICQISLTCIKVLSEQYDRITHLKCSREYFNDSLMTFNIFFK